MHPGYIVTLFMKPRLFYFLKKNLAQLRELILTAMVLIWADWGTALLLVCGSLFDAKLRMVNICKVCRGSMHYEVREA